MNENHNITHQQGIYRLITPQNDLRIPLVLDSPHSGRVYPEEFLTPISRHDLICGEDRFVDELFAAAPAHGASLLCAEFPRSFIDVNRYEGDIAPHMMTGKWPKNIPLQPSTKSKSGIGLIREYFHNGQKFYHEPLATKTVLARIEQYYRPYHAALEHILAQTIQEYGFVLHLNCHSMPYESAPHCPHPSFLNGQGSHADIILGDLDSRTCAPQWRERIGDILEDLGFSVLHNKGFKGAEIVKRYGHPANNVHSLQIEINRRLYLDKHGRYKSDHFERLQNALSSFIKHLAADIKAR